jgi:hypothetical protein
MKCKNLIIITGISCQGKTYISNQLYKKYGFYVIHTDWFYHPLDREPLKCQVGEENKEKNKLIRQQRPMMTETTIREGSHIGNRKELEIFKRELSFNGKVYMFEINSPNLQGQFKNKHKEQSDKNWNDIQKWFNKIYDLKDVVIVENIEEIINFLETQNVCLPG